MVPSDRGFPASPNATLSSFACLGPPECGSSNGSYVAGSTIANSHLASSSTYPASCKSSLLAPLSKGISLSLSLTHTHSLSSTHAHTQKCKQTCAILTLFYSFFIVQLKIILGFIFLLAEFSFLPSFCFILLWTYLLDVHLAFYVMASRLFYLYQPSFLLFLRANHMQ